MQFASAGVTSGPASLPFQYNHAGSASVPSSQLPIDDGTANAIRVEEELRALQKNNYIVRYMAKCLTKDGRLKLILVVQLSLLNYVLKSINQFSLT
jgi:hypothetical protein